MLNPTPAQVHAFVLCRDAYQDLKSGEWTIRGVIWNFGLLETRPINFSAYYHISGVTAPVELSVRIIDTQTDAVIWESSMLVRSATGFQSGVESKMDLNEVPIPDLAASGETRCIGVLLLNGVQAATSQEIAIH
jgi:hypothetical protein